MKVVEYSKPKRGRGAPRKEEGRKKFTTISIERDLYDFLHEKANELESTLGFKPTSSQVLRHVILSKAEGGQR